MSPYEVVFGRKMRPGTISVAPWINKPTQSPAQRFESIEQRLYSSKKERQGKGLKKKSASQHWS